ncbi:hypothetical protein LY76DRAFT_592647 [Colletotrichum caudatum]|nr:hypothetical protein LY76DRAFT_592647 [Colletotrichum caudatum]
MNLNLTKLFPSPASPIRPASYRLFPPSSSSSSSCRPTLIAPFSLSIGQITPAHLTATSRHEQATASAAPAPAACISPESEGVIEHHSISLSACLPVSLSACLSGVN